MDQIFTSNRVTIHRRVIKPRQIDLREGVLPGPELVDGCARIDAIRLSALTGAGLDDLRAELIARAGAKPVVSSPPSPAAWSPLD